MRKHGFDALVTSPNPNKWDSGSAYTRYLSQIGGNNAGACVVFPLEGEPVAIVPPVPGPDRWKEAYDWISEYRDIGLDWTFGTQIIAVLKDLGATAGTIGLVGLAGVVRSPEGTFAHGIVQSLESELPEAEFVNATAEFNLVRYVKSQEEIEALRISTGIAEGMLDTLIADARVGVAENVVWANMVREQIRLGGEIPCMLLWDVGPTQRRNAYLPTERPFHAGDIITLEADGRHKGYNGQLTTHAFLGPIPGEYRDMFAVQQEVLSMLYPMVRPGVGLGELSDAATQFTAGSAFKCRILMHGRGVGEDPPIAIYSTRDKRNSDWLIQENSCFVLKPMVSVGKAGTYDHDKFVYWGDTIVATPGGAQRLGTKKPELIELPV